VTPLLPELALESFADRLDGITSGLDFAGRPLAAAQARVTGASSSLARMRPRVRRHQIRSS
jgi:hypothetical protein